MTLWVSDPYSLRSIALIVLTIHHKEHCYITAQNQIVMNSVLVPKYECKSAPALYSDDALVVSEREKLPNYLTFLGGW